MLVGRAPELARLDVMLDRVGGNEAAVLELVGEPGIGKSRLLDALCRRADERGYLVLRGRSGQFERRYSDEAARELRKLGRRVQRAGRRGQAEAGSAALSAREREIAELVAEGKSNKEIAAELYLSVRTVENHLRGVFAKLGVRKRAAVPAHLGERSPE